MCTPEMHLCKPSLKKDKNVWSSNRNMGIIICIPYQRNIQDAIAKNKIAISD